MSDSPPTLPSGDPWQQHPQPDMGRPDHWLPPRLTPHPPRPRAPQPPPVEGAATGGNIPTTNWNASLSAGGQPLRPYSEPARTPPPGTPWAGVAVGVIAVMVAVALVMGFAAPLIWGAVGSQPVPTTTPAAPPVPPTPSTGRTPAPTPPTSSPSPTAPPAPAAPQLPDHGASRWQLPERDWPPLPTPVPQDEVWERLQVHALMDEPPAVLMGCPAPRTVDNEQEFRELVAQQWHCVHTAWMPRLEAHGFSTIEPLVVIFAGTGADSDCGYLDAPAFYCSAGQGTAYFGAGHLAMAMEWDLSINEMVNHEYGHHLQSLAGITVAKMQLGQNSENERRAELQATCWSAAMTRNSRDVGFDQGDWDSWHQRLETMLIDGVHGSRESILRWGTRGLYAQTLGDCNTWAVDAAEVS